YDEEEYDEEEYDEEYDEIFSIEEDLRREQRRQFIQYICVATGAVAVIALVLFASVMLTRNRLEQQENARIIAAAAIEAQQQIQQQLPETAIVPTTLTTWPESQFPQIPVFDSPAYETTLSDGYARIVIPSSATEGYESYLQTLAQLGAKVYINTDRLSVLDLDGVEIHLVTANQQNRIVLCDEEAIQYNDVDYRAFDLPTSFKLVSAKADSAMGRILTYRNVSVNQALEYTTSLITQYGWSLSGNLDMSESRFYAVYVKNNLRMTVDYFSSGDNFTIKLDFVS
ncbi:MAG: hypothetical protein Q4D04_16095, partial [Clostridia bacterium]|nr:hypothetical protein [Clostridia bacterium]